MRRVTFIVTFRQLYLPNVMKHMRSFEIGYRRFKKAAIAKKNATAHATMTQQYVL